MITGSVIVDFLVVVSGVGVAIVDFDITVGICAVIFCFFFLDEGFLASSWFSFDC